MKKLTKKDVDVICSWMYQNGRELDIALLNNYCFEEDKEMVLNGLTLFLNEDGGFAKGLEPDLQNQDSNVLATATAFEIMQEVGYRYDPEDDFFKEIIDGACKWLFNQAPKDEKGRFSLISESNNKYPCAEWWKYKDEKYCTLPFNPTPALIGQIMLFTSPNSKYYEKAEGMLTDILRLYFTNNVGDRYDLHNFYLLFDALDKLEYSDNFIEECKEKWLSDIDYCLTRKKENFNSPSAILILDIVSDTKLLKGKFSQEIIDHLDFLVDNRTNAGLWVPNWSWGNSDSYFDIAYILWSSYLTTNNLRLLNKFKRVEEGAFDE